MTVLDGLDALRDAVGHDLGVSAWRVVTVDDVDRFAEATGAPAGADVVPPFLLLSLSNCFLPEILEVRGIEAGVNYGTGSVRFPTPVAVGARVRGRAEMVDATDVAGGVQTTIRITIEVAVEAGGPPGVACVIESLTRWLGPAAAAAPA